MQRERAVRGAGVREDARAVAVQREHVGARVEIEVADEQARRRRRAELVGDEELAAGVRRVQPHERARHRGRRRGVAREHEVGSAVGIEVARRDGARGARGERRFERERAARVRDTRRRRRRRWRARAPAARRRTSRRAGRRARRAARRRRRGVNVPPEPLLMSTVLVPGAREHQVDECVAVDVAGRNGAAVDGRRRRATCS